MAERDSGNKEKILNAATKLIIEKGPHNTSLADIAEKVNISKGTLYYYYRTKSELIYDVTERHMNDITHEILLHLKKVKTDSSPQEILSIVFNTVLEAQTGTHLHIYLLHEAITNNESLKTRFRETYQKWRFLFSRGLRNIVKDREKARTIAQLILICIDGCTVEKMLNVKNLDINDISAFLLQ